MELLPFVIITDIGNKTMNTAIRNVMLPLATNYSSDNLGMGVIQGAEYCRIQIRLRVSDHPNTRKMTPENTDGLQRRETFHQPQLLQTPRHHHEKSSRTHTWRPPNLSSIR